MDNAVCVKAKKVSQITALMHVSRQFRHAILQSKHWFQFGFDFRSLVYISQHWQREPEELHPVNSLIKALFDDEAVVESLMQKTEWAFPRFCPELWFGVITRLPYFSQTVRKLWVCGDLHLAFNRLPPCSNVTELGVLDNNPGETSSVDLTRISQTFPNLQHLYLAITLSCQGSISSLRHLLSFELLALDWLTHDTTGPVSKRYLPLASASTLTTLRVYGYAEDPWGRISLAPFTALQHLKYSEKLGDVVGVLRSVCTKLVSLELQLYTDLDFEDVVGPDLVSFDHPCLSNLKSIVLEDVRFGHTFGFMNPTGCMAVLHNVANSLPDLENVTVEYAQMDLSNIWILGLFRRLRTLTWIFAQEEPWTWLRLDEMDPVSAIEKAFKDRETKPRVTLCTHRELRGDRIPGEIERRSPLHTSWYDRGDSRWPLHMDQVPEYEKFRW